MASVLTKAQVELLRRRLEDERTRLLRVLREEPPAAPRDDERAEYEEVAQRETEATERFAVRDREGALLEDVQRAIAKLDAGTYGLGETTGEPIPYRRLDAVPWARD